MLVLASGSPQRRAILAQLGVAFTVQPADVEEATGGDPGRLVEHNAVLKARAVPGECVLGADTAVALAGAVYGKPADEAQARSFLEALSGREHCVWSGLALIERGRARTAVDCATVTFRDLSREDIDWYLATGEWRDRAGGYAIQGAGMALVERMEGDHSCVVGLPVAVLMRLAPELVRGG